jgi:methionyl-tRNA formyltransferase
MRLLCCLNRDLPSNLALNLLLPALRHHDVHVCLTEQVGDAAALRDEPRERRELRNAEQWLPNEVLFPLIERSNLPDRDSRYLTFVEIERHRGISIEQMPDPNSAQGLATIRAFAPDLIVAIRYGAIFKAAAIAAPKLGVLNLHSGLLPAYRGVLATFRALLNGDKEIGCTLHWISDPTIDTGGIIGIRTIPVDRNGSLLAHVLALYPPGVTLLSGVIEELAIGRRPRATEQPRHAGAYHRYPTATEWAEFLRLGWRVVDASDLFAAFRRYIGQNNAPPPGSAG